MDFIGASVFDVVTDEKPRDRTVSTLKLVGILDIKWFDILGTAPTKPAKEESAEQ